MFDALKPWMNFEMYSFIQKKKQEEESKILSIAKTDSLSKVETVNAFDEFMKKLGINPNATEGK